MTQPNSCARPKRFPLGRPACNYQAIRNEAYALQRAGFLLTLVIPATLSAEHWPVKDKDGNPVKDKDGNPVPAFKGKNPSLWLQNGEPRLLSPAKPLDWEEIRRRLDMAERQKLPIGLAIVADQLAVVDLDAKHYSDGADGVTREIERLLTEHPDLAGTRIERTPSGGAHIFLRVADGMAAWATETGHHCNFATEPGGPHRGEILHGSRIAVTAPTVRHDGAYSLVVADHECDLVTVPSLEALGIVPVSRRQTLEQPARIVLPDQHLPRPTGLVQAPALAALLGEKAQAVLRGERPYGEDRSTNLAGLAREAFGAENWCRHHGRPVIGTADDLIAEAVQLLGIDDKAGRVLSGINREDCSWRNGDNDKARSRYDWHAGPQLSGPPSSTGQGAQQQAAQPAGQPQARKVIPVDQVRQQLAEALADGLGGADLAALVAELAEASGIAAHSIQRIADALQRDRGQEAAVAAEALQLAAEADRQEIGQVLTPAYLLPPAVAHAIEMRTRYLPCEGPSAVLPFLAAVAGLVKLGTRVEGCAAAGFRVPVNLFGCLVGRSGTKKTPVHALLVDEPTHALRAELAASHAHAMDEWQQACKALKKGEPKPEPPRQKRLKVGDYTGEALAEQLQTQQEAGLGLLVHRDELSGLFGSLNQYRGGRGGDEQQLLELFDGGGLTSLRVSGHRCYSRSQLSIFGGTQPDILRELVANGDASGLWARFLFVPLQERAIPLPMVTDPAEVAAVEAAAQTLADTCRAVYRMAPQTYRLAPAAAERFASYELSRQRAAMAATVGAQSAVYGKSAGKVLRVAGLLHLLLIACGEADSGALIEADTIDRTTALVDYLDAWALSLHAEVAAGGVGQAMRMVHRVAEAAGQPIRWKELSARLSPKQRKEIDAGAFKAAAHALAEAGYGETEAGRRGAVSYRATRPLP